MTLESESEDEEADGEVEEGEVEELRAALSPGEAKALEKLEEASESGSEMEVEEEMSVETGEEVPV